MTIESEPTSSPKATEPAEQSTSTKAGGNQRSLHPSALRDAIPATGLREYWYPGILEHKVKAKRPTTLKICGTDVVFFRGEKGVAAVADACPHRGGALSRGKCEFPGTITCPYHGWTFDSEGECRAVLGEGPTSRIPGMPEARVRTYPTLTLKGVVWVWMGEGEPAPPEHDIPPQFFDDSLLIQNSVTTWDCNWRPACENMIDSHVFYVHRRSFFFMMLMPVNLLLNLSNIGPRRPRPRVIEGRGVAYEAKQLNFTVKGSAMSDKAPEPETKQWPPRDSYQDVYPGLDNQKWPKDHWRLPWAGIVSRVQQLRKPVKPLITDQEWNNFHLPATFQVDYMRYLYSRLTVPIDENTSRIFYFHTTRRRGTLHNLLGKVYFEVFHNWMINYNFSGQDEDVVQPLHYDTPEHLSATDVFPLTIRRAMVENARRPAPATNNNGRGRK
ncbi:MAG: Rieske 2Fe-2S domain-containing protein [Nocardiaceae bacterium]|nr:Rieske 2Fe-2S domain-containing protein [Nocardiaceae bacterium]